MATEIERKYLVTDESWRDDAVGVPVRQGYLSVDGDVTVRVRVEGTLATLTVKGPAAGISRDEFEYPIPVEDARELLERHCAERIVHKTRYRVHARGRLWQIDEFHHRNEGLVTAEVELEADDEVVELPRWIGEEVSTDRRYANSSIARDPWPWD